MSDILLKLRGRAAGYFVLILYGHRHPVAGLLHKPPGGVLATPLLPAFLQNQRIRGFPDPIRAAAPPAVQLQTVRSTAFFLLSQRKWETFCKPAAEKGSSAGFPRIAAGEAQHALRWRNSGRHPDLQRIWRETYALENSVQLFQRIWIVILEIFCRVL